MISSAASTMGHPGLIAAGYVMKSGIKEFFATSFNSSGGAMSTILLRSGGQFVNAVAILPCTTSVSSCRQFSLYVGGLVSSTTQTAQGFLTLLVESQLSESTTFQCDEASQLTDGIIMPTTESVYPLAFSVGFTTAPGASIYNNVLLVKLFNNEVSTIRVRIQEHQQVIDCQLKQLGPGFLVRCLVQTQGLGQLVTFYVNDQLSVQALPSTYAMLSDAGFSSGISFIWSAPAMTSAIWQPPIFSVTPTLHPSRLPSVVPSKVPTRCPSMKPTHAPTLSQNPTTETKYPTVSQEPTLEPSSVPSESSSDAPSAVPSESSSARPTVKPENSNPPSYRPVFILPTFVPSKALQIFARPTLSPSFTTTHMPSNFNATSQTTSSTADDQLLTWETSVIGVGVVVFIFFGCLLAMEESRQFFRSLCTASTWETDPDNYIFHLTPNDGEHQENETCEHNSLGSLFFG
jgi:hypothetical protein